MDSKTINGQYFDIRKNINSAILELESLRNTEQELLFGLDTIVDENSRDEKGNYYNVELIKLNIKNLNSAIKSMRTGLSHLSLTASKYK